MEDLQKELEEQRELATNRLSELDRLHQNHRDVLQQLEHLKMDVSRRFFTLEQWPDSCRCRSITHRVVMADFHARAIDERRILSLSLSLSVCLTLVGRGADPAAARVGGGGDDRVQVPAVAVLGALQRVDGAEDAA